MIQLKAQVAWMTATTAAMLLAVGGLVWPIAARSQSTDGAAQPRVSALVKTAPLQHQALTRQLAVLGDVATGKIESVNFPSAGQVTRLWVSPGQRVRHGTPLAVLSSDPTAQLAYTQAGTAANFARHELRRNEELFALQLATSAQVDAARRALRDAEANLAAQGKLGGATAEATVKAPFDGVVTAIAVAQGDRVQPGAQILQLGRAEALRVMLGIEPDERPLVRPGMPVVITTLQGGGPSAQGTVALVQDIVDPKSRLVGVTVTVPRAPSSGFLIPGMHVRASIELGKTRAWVVPRDAVLTDAQGAYLYQVADGKARRAAVKVTQQTGAAVAVEGKTLDARQPVVLLGNYELQDGMSVREGAQ